MCGIVGVSAPGAEAAGLAALGLFALQHRGQESAGVAVSDGDGVMVYKDLGLVSQVLDERRLPSLRGHLAIAHCRYSTTGSTRWENSQPAFRQGPRRAVAVAHNGNLVNPAELLELLPGGRRALQGSSDTELLTALLASAKGGDLLDVLRSTLPKVRGAYALVVLDERRLLGIRDPHGLRPLVLGRLPQADSSDEPGWVLASETAGLDVLGATYVRDVDPGEIVVLGEPGGPRSLRFATGREQLCVFELLYFARPDSVMLGRNLYEVRRRLGEALAREAPADADLVMPVPETGGPAAAGYAEASGIPYRDGMVRNRYAGRTFIQPSAALRQRGVNVKLSPLPEQVRDRRLVVVDDSIVRGTTTRQIVALLRRAGAREIHLRISAPPIFHPCFYGIDTQIETELIAARHSLEAIRAYLEADSLAYLSIEGVQDAIGLPRERFCFACFDGRYPVPVPYDVIAHKFVLEEPPVATPR
ncbi:MAG: amidophosphoribosyltransferase [Candidatus Limnocylindrales bacterium]